MSTSRLNPIHEGRPTGIQREALRLFQRDGYAATSVEAIAEAAEVSPSTFFRYFPSKEDVVLTDFVDEAMIERFVDTPPELDFFGAMAHAVRVGFGEMSDEDFSLENLPQQPAPHGAGAAPRVLARGAAVQLLAEAIGRRTGRGRDEPACSPASRSAPWWSPPEVHSEEPVLGDQRAMTMANADRMATARPTARGCLSRSEL